VTPGYFDAMGIARLRGRTFTRLDVEGSMPVVVVSANMAQAFWPRADAVGARIKYQGALRTVVGVVAGVRHFGLDHDAPFEMYTPHAQQPSYHTMTLVIRSGGFRAAGSGFFGFSTRYLEPETSEPAVALMPSIRRELWAIDRDVPISAVRTLDQVVSDSTEAPRFRTVLLTAFAGLALILAIVGVAGVIGHGVSRRTQEIGVRVALGATTGRVVAMIVGEGLRPTLVGILIGAAGALAIARVVSGLLFDVAPADPAVMAISAATLVVAALAAAWLPARRAARVDPMIALRSD